MKILISLFLLICPLFAQEVIPFEDVTLTPSVPKVLTLHLPNVTLNSSETLFLSTEFTDDSQEKSLTQFTLLNGPTTSHWVISNSTRSGGVLLCFQTAPGYDTVNLVIRSNGRVKIQIAFVLKDIKLWFDRPEEVTLNDQLPGTFLIDPVSAPDSSRNDRYTITVENLDNSSKEVCMVVAAYANRCPFKTDFDRGVNGADMWFTALGRGAMTIKYESFQFNMPFYVSIIVLKDDKQCHLEMDDQDFVSIKNRTKRVRITVEKGLPYTSYITPIAISVIMSIGFIIIAFIVMSTKRLNDEEGESEGDSVYYSPNGSQDIVQMGRRSRMKTSAEDTTQKPNQDVVDQGNDSLKPIVAENPPSAYQELKDRCYKVIDETNTRRDRVVKGLDRLDPEAKLTHMTKILEDDVWFRRNRSRVYCYLVPLLSLFYFIPSIQFVFLVKETESMTGSLDLCYHNFECSKPLNIFSDFNHVISNISYVLFGLFFMLIVRYKARLLPEEQKPKNDHKAGKGILQQLSIFYAMGFALAAQGFFSICYHVCPTNHSLQFDSTMMYVICMLCMVKLYQLRHPDANANAYSFFYFLGGIVLVEALALYSDSWWVYGFFIIIYLCMTVFIAVDCYFMGVGRLDSSICRVIMKDIFYDGWTNVREKKLPIRYKKRFAFALCFCLFNFAHAVYIAVSKFHSPRSTVTHVVLLILAGNLFMYISYYVFRKNISRCQNFYAACRNEEDAVDARYALQVRGKRVPCFLSAGSIFAITAVVLGGIAIHFYLWRSANRNVSPAESRNLNEPCAYFDFFDNHDMWHFFSAGAIFMAFLALLTVDDDMLNVPREEIEVF